MEILKFAPLLMSLVWGGEKIAPYKGIETAQKNIGESWEISAVPGKETLVSEGRFAGRSITSLAEEFKGALLGEKVYAATGAQFPLLIKFIDAKADLSIQVHPDDALAAVRHNGSKGKTEMWYVVGADKDAHLLSGLSQAITPAEYERRVADDSITEVLARYNVAPGDVFFLPAGRIHAICSGCFIAEIQQTSDITYRIYDYGRLGLDGKPRQLHTEQAKDAIDYTVHPDYRTPYTPALNQEVRLVSCPYFTTSLWDLSQPVRKDLSSLDSFVVVMCLAGEATLATEESQVTVRQGETVLVPATARFLSLTPASSSAKLLTACIE